MNLWKTAIIASTEITMAMALISSGCAAGSTSGEQQNIGGSSKTVNGETDQYVEAAQNLGVGFSTIRRSDNNCSQFEEFKGKCTEAGASVWNCVPNANNTYQNSTYNMLCTTSASTTNNDCSNVLQNDAIYFICGTTATIPEEAAKN